MFLILLKGEIVMSKISDNSPLYENLIETYNTYKDKERFEKCYEIVDGSSYKDIHHLITMLKEFQGSAAEIELPNDTVKALSQFLINFFNKSYFARTAYLMDILEEARCRKRPQAK